MLFTTALEYRVHSYSVLRHLLVKLNDAKFKNIGREFYAKKANRARRKTIISKVFLLFKQITTIKY